MNNEVYPEELYLKELYSKFNTILHKKKEIQPIVIGIVSGFFDPIGVQHCLLFEEAKKLCDELIIGVNSDKCALMKKGQPAFMPFEIRKQICESLKWRNKVMGFDDSDGSASLLIQDVYDMYKVKIENGEVILKFINGGDRAPSQEICPEQKYVDEFLPNKIQMIYGVGGYNKYASSSEYLRDWINNTMKRYKINFKLEKKY